MQARFMVEKPQEIVFTMKITMSVKDWEYLRDALSEGQRLSSRWRNRVWLMIDALLKK
jgi:hypothetical protein